MDRRTAALGLMAACAVAGDVAGETAGAPAAVPQNAAWSSWAARFLGADGRVIDDQAGGISHSEGQGYGLLLAQAHGDKTAFRGIEDWTTANLQVRQDHLMAWRWHVNGAVRAMDWHSATDGDVFRAWALLRAGRATGCSDWVARAVAIARDIDALCIAPDPRAPRLPILRPGAEARMTADRVLFNPSYIMPRALRALGTAAGTPRLIAAADHGERLIADLAGQGAVPDWIDVTEQGFDAPREHDLRSGYDALRLPLYLIWSGQGGHPGVARGLETLQRARAPGHLAVVTDADGAVTAESDQPGYLSIAALARCRPRPVTPTDAAGQSYYPATLQLLAQVAAREQDACETL